MIRLSLLKRTALVLIAFIAVCIVIVNITSFNRKEPWTATKKDAVVVFNDTSGDVECVQTVHCSKGKQMILLRPESLTKPPLICLNNRRLFDASKFVMGLNIALLDSTTNRINGVHYLSVQDSDYSVIKLLAQIQKHEIILGASYGDISSKLSAEARQLLHMFGLSLEHFKTESSVLFVGQLGLSNTEAYEKITALRVREPEYYHKCLTTPMGRLLDITMKIPEAHHIDEGIVAQLSAVKGRKLHVKFGSEVPNCGHPRSCPEGEIAMSFYSGKDKDDSPQLCVNGRFVIDRDLNSAGRGLNLVVIDSKTHQVMRTGHYDTYSEDSAALVLFLEQLSPGEILAVISFDEASNSLSDMAKHIFYELGSSLVHHLKFRASWYFIGQKGIDGYTPFEDMNLPSGNDWAKPISTTVCVPSVLDGLKSTDFRVPKSQNMLRRHFCARYDGYEDFCDETRLDMPLVPRRTMVTDPIYSVPILLAGGLSANNIRLCLESIYEQDGINPQNIVVAFDSVYGEVADLSALFQARALPVNDSSTYHEFVLKSIDHMMTLFPSAPCLIVIEEDTFLRPGFLSFFGQLLPYFVKDDTATVILAYNGDGSKNFQQDSSLAYRIENIVAAGAYMMKKSFYEEYLRGRKKCCTRVKSGWLFPGVAYMPAVSRVKLTRTFDLNTLAEDRTTTKDSSVNVDLLKGNEKIVNAGRLDEESYDADLGRIIADGKKFHLKGVVDCSKDVFVTDGGNQTSVQSVVIVYEGNNMAFLELARCFNLRIVMDFPSGIYKGIVRFSTMRTSYVLVSSISPFLNSVK